MNDLTRMWIVCNTLFFSCPRPLPKSEEPCCKGPNKGWQRLGRDGLYFNKITLLSPFSHQQSSDSHMPFLAQVVCHDRKVTTTHEYGLFDTKRGAYLVAAANELAENSNFVDKSGYSDYLASVLALEKVNLDDYAQITAWYNNHFMVRERVIGIDNTRARYCVVVLGDIESEEVAVKRFKVMMTVE